MLVVGIALLIGLDWDGIGNADEGGGGDAERELGEVLSREFGVPPNVEFVCTLPVVGEAPCLPGDSAGQREVTLTFADYELPEGVDPREHARRIAVVAHDTSPFVRESNKTEVVFQEGDEWASVLRKYSFTAGQLTATPD